jgi:hypothetical protein
MTASSPDNASGEMVDRGLKVTYRMLEAGTTLLEGSREALEAFAQIILSQARSGSDCGFEAAPVGPGSALFTSSSDVGLYVHLLPCASHDERAAT